MKRDRVFFIGFRVKLREDGTNSVTRCIGVENEFPFKVRWLKTRCGNDSLFEGVEGECASSSPFPRNSFLEKVIERSCF